MRCALPPCREQTNTGGDRNVERFNRSQKWNTDQAIAQLAGEPPQARALGAEHPRDRPGEICVEQAFLAGRVRTKDPHAALFELELSGKIKQMPGKNFVKSF